MMRNTSRRRDIHHVTSWLSEGLLRNTSLSYTHQVDKKVHQMLMSRVFYGWLQTSAQGLGRKGHTTNARERNRNPQEQKSWSQWAELTSFLAASFSVLYPNCFVGNQVPSHPPNPHYLRLCFLGKRAPRFMKTRR